jgi:hypothetical protein
MPDSTTFDPEARLREAMLRQLRISIGRLDNDSNPEEISAIIDRIAAADLDEITTERLLKTINLQSGTTIGTLRKQLNNARAQRGDDDEQISGVIAEFNRQFAVVNEAGKPWVVRWHYDFSLKREVLERSSFYDFKNLYLNRQINGQTVGVFWLKHPDRRQYLEGVVFDPTGQAPADRFNLWRGFSVEPKPGDWSLMQSHIENVVCGGKTEASEYVLNWMARAVQKPELRAEVALVLRGKKGAGKGAVGNWFCRIFGQHGMQIYNPIHLVGRFNVHLRDCLLLFADEAFYAGDKQHEGVLKGLITEPYLVIEGKRQNVVKAPNMLHLIMASNSDWVIPASSDERRYAVFDVLDIKLGDRAYFTALNKQMEEGGLAAMLYDLLKRDIAQFEVRDFPQTKALKMQKTLSLNSLARWWLAVLDRGYLWKSRHGANYFRQWQEFYSSDLLRRSYGQWCDENRPYDRKSGEELGKFFTEIYSPARPGGRHPMHELDSIERSASGSLDEISIVWKERPHGYRVEGLDVARDRFAENHDVIVPWERENE